MRNGFCTPAKLKQEGWNVAKQNEPTTIQRFTVKRTGMIVDAVVLTGDRYLVLQDDALHCCKIMVFKPDELEYRCEYQRKDHLTTDVGLAASIDTAITSWRQHQIDKLRL